MSEFTQAMSRDTNLPAAMSLVPSPRAVRKLALVLGIGLLALPPLLTLLPWMQNIPTTGRVVALDPLDRLQTIPAPVTGRLVRVLVQEGSEVKRGEVLVEMSDQDPLFAERLEQQYRLTLEKMRAAEGQVAFYSQQLANLEAARELAVSAAKFELNMAQEGIRGAEQSLAAAEAELEQKAADRTRRLRLFERGVVSELDQQRAEADYRAAAARVEAARADVQRAFNARQASEAEVGRVGKDQQAKIESIKSMREEARAKAALAQKDLTKVQTDMERQKTRFVLAPRDGRVFRIMAAARADLLEQGEPLLELVPSTDRLGVELWVRGNDAPLVGPGRKVRLQFEGWPAVQFAGWPSVAVGTFGGEVLLVDAQDDGQGRFRILVQPDPADAPWPDERVLRQGVRANGWVLLDEVRLGYEVWRQLNGFPPALQSSTAASGSKG
jgi:multidrug efflux pump subunit AcrA (membrane-fusion protein)